MKKDQTAVSVIIPYYNLGIYLPEAIASVRAQTHLPAEIIVINDGSTDPYSIDVVSQLENKADVTVYHTENHGASAARNYGISHATSQYILCLDADDLLHPTFLEKTIPYLQQHADVGVVATHVDFFGNRNGKWSPKESPAHHILWQNPIPSCSLFRKQCWCECGGYKDLVACQDWEFWLSIIMEHGWRWRVVPESLYRYRQRSGSISEYRQAHRADLLRQIVQLHPRLYAEHVADIFVALDTKSTLLQQKLNQREQGYQTQNQTTYKLQHSANGHAPKVSEASLFDEAHQNLRHRAKNLILPKLPLDAHILVVSKGDPEFLTLDGRHGAHFPQSADGAYLGYHPTDSHEIIEQLERLMVKGAGYLLIPRSGFWWLNRCPEFKAFLADQYPAVVDQDDTCLLYDLTNPIEYHTFSVVIATYKRADFLEAAVTSVFDQNYPKDKYELIIIDNDSPDNTDEVVERIFENAPISCHYYVEKQNGLSYARNLGIAKSRFEFVAQLDDDAIANPNWLNAFNKVIHEHHAMVVGGRVEKSFEPGFTPPDWFNYQYVNHFFGVNYRDRGREEKVFRIRHPLYLSGGNTAYARRLFDHFDGFRADLGRNGKTLLAGEESFLNLILDHNDIPMYYTDDGYIHHYVGSDRLNKTHLRHKARWSGISNARVQSLFFGHAAVRRNLRNNWQDIWVKAVQVIKNRHDPENFSRICRIIYHISFLQAFCKSYISALIHGERYEPPPTTWTDKNWLAEVERWPNHLEKFEQLYQLHMKLDNHTAAQKALVELAKYGAVPTDKLPETTSQWQRLHGTWRREKYEQLLEHIKQVVTTAVPAQATVAVLSKGDDQLLNMAGRQGVHFPQNHQGQYAGFYPANSQEAIAQLQQVQEKGVNYVLIPSPALWWLDYYGEFTTHLERQGKRLVDQPDCCVIFALN